MDSVFRVWVIVMEGLYMKSRRSFWPEISIVSLVDDQDMIVAFGSKYSDG